MRLAKLNLGHFFILSNYSYKFELIWLEKKNYWKKLKINNGWIFDKMINFVIFRLKLYLQIIRTYIFTALSLIERQNFDFKN